MPTTLTRNQRRADNAAEAIATNYTNDREGLTDILADLMHYAAREGYDFAAALKAASHHYKTEKGGT